MQRIIILLFVLTQLQGLAQTHEGDSWFVGLYSHSVNFGQPNLPADTTNVGILINAAFANGKANICDTDGNIMLLSEGFRVINRQGQYIDNSDTLVSVNYFNWANGVNYDQSSIFLPMEDGIVYFVTPTINDTMLANVWNYGNSTKAPYNLLLYSVIDMKMNGGAGRVTKRMQPILENKELSRTQMMACRHSNGKDWWLLKMAGDSNNVYTFLFTQDSVYNYGIQRLPFYGNTYFDVVGQMTFNSQGTKMATTCSSNLGKVFVSDFNRCNGELSNPIQFDVPIRTYPEGEDSTTSGVAFSPNGRFLYVSKWSHIMQYDFQDGTWYTVAQWDTTYTNFAGFHTCGLAVNNKIYIGNHHGYSKQMSVIDNPDYKGAACGFCRKCLRADYSTYGWLQAIPNVPNCLLGYSADTCFPLATQTLIETEEWKLYPNPATTKITFSNTQNKTKLVFDCCGKLICKTTDNEIDVSKFSKGLYFVRCNGSVKKLLVE